MRYYSYSGNITVIEAVLKARTEEKVKKEVRAMAAIATCAVFVMAAVEAALIFSGPL